MSERDHILGEQIDYYRARAGEYDEWFLRVGRYDHGEEHRQAWLGEVAEVREALELARPGGRILEIACGTGLWTERLLPYADGLTAVDASAEMIEQCRGRVGGEGVEFVQADVFEWQPRERYDFVFFGFWLSHVPENRFEAFWKLVASALRPAGTVFFVDSRFVPAATATDHKAIDRSGVVERKLNDGRSFEIVKVYYEPAGLYDRLSRLGWEGSVDSTERFFLHGHVRQRG